MKKISLLLLTSVLFILIIMVGGVSAQESGETAAKKYGVTFPIAELGNCESFAACRDYCENKSNGEQCVAFAKKKGFYKDVQNDTKRRTMVDAAKTQLGCTSEESCREVCQKEENFEKCNSFAQKHGVGEGPRGKPQDKAILQKAQSILGCNSEASCKAVCEQDTNKEKCSEFAKQTGLGGGIRKVGPGGCNSEESCRSYCEKNMDECRKFGSGPGGGQPPPEAARRGPGGCDSEESCKEYCEKNPQECKQFGDGQNRGQPSDNVQRKGPGGCDSEESCKAYCEKNPQECGGAKRSDSSGQFQGRPPEGRGDRQNMSSEEFCKNNPDKCQGPRGEGGRPPEGRQFQGERQGERPPGDQSQSGRSPEGFRPPEGQGGPPPGGEIRTGESQQPSSGEQVRGVSTTVSLLQQFINRFIGQ